MITVEQVLESARESAKKSKPFWVKVQCPKCGESFRVELPAPGRYQLDCVNDECRARVTI